MDGTVKAFMIPQIQNLPSTYFLRLKLEDMSAQTVSSNFYWLSTKDDSLDWEKSTWYYTPTTSYADMTQLQKLPPVKLAISASALRRGADETTHVTVSNTSNSLAFFIQLQIKRKPDNKNILPVVWQDNYFSLLPGESRKVTATYKVKDLGLAPALLVVDGWNIAASSSPILRKR
jgi:exo-1,4-beta-D-glucosaminidase